MNIGYIFQRTPGLVHCRAFFNMWPNFYSIHTSKNLLWMGLLTSLLILTTSFTASVTLWHLTASQHIIEFIFKIDWRGEEIELPSFYDWDTEMHYLINLRLVWAPRNLFLEYLALQFGVLFPASSTAAAGILRFSGLAIHGINCTSRKGGTHNLLHKKNLV